MIFSAYSAYILQWNLEAPQIWEFVVPSVHFNVTYLLREAAWGVINLNALK